MFNLLRNLFLLGLLIVAAWAAVTIDLGGKTALTHALEIWRAPIVQEKARAAESGLRRELAEAIERLRRQASAPAAAGTGDLLTSADDQVIEESIARRLVGR